MRRDLPSVSASQTQQRTRPSPSSQVSMLPHAGHLGAAAGPVDCPNGSGEGRVGLPFGRTPKRLLCASVAAEVLDPLDRWRRRSKLGHDLVTSPPFLPAHNTIHWPGHFSENGDRSWLVACYNLAGPGRPSKRLCRALPDADAARPCLASFMLWPLPSSLCVFWG